MFNSVYHCIMELKLNVASISDKRFAATSALVLQAITEAYALGGELMPPHHILRASDIKSAKGDELIEFANAATVHNLRRYPRPVFIILGTPPSLLGLEINIRLALIHELDMSFMKIELF